MTQLAQQDLLALNQELLDSITSGDWATYSHLCDPELSAIEPEAPGQVVKGLAFHKFYFSLAKKPGPRQTTMCQPVVHVAGDMAVIAYVRLVQKVEDGRAKTVASAETRIWRRHGKSWRHLHFHRSPLA